MFETMLTFVLTNILYLFLFLFLGVGSTLFIIVVLLGIYKLINRNRRRNHIRNPANIPLRTFNSLVNIVRAAEEREDQERQARDTLALINHASNNVIVNASTFDNVTF